MSDLPKVIDSQKNLELEPVPCSDWPVALHSPLESINSCRHLGPCGPLTLHFFSLSWEETLGEILFGA